MWTQINESVSLPSICCVHEFRVLAGQSLCTRNGKPGNFILGCAECDEEYKKFSQKKCSVAGRFLQ